MRLLRGASRLLTVLALVSSAAVQAPAQEPAFNGVARGVLLESDAPAATGEFSIRMQGTNQVYRFSFDSKTYVEREQNRIAMSGLHKGDSVEVVSDRDATIGVHYARTVHVVETRSAPRAPMSNGRSRLYRSPVEFIVPRGNLTYSGLIAKLNADRLVLRTRLDGEKMIVLRRDTRYLDSGSIVEASDLQPNTRVFIRAGRNLDDEIEAYQIIWGEILKPTRPH